MRELANRIEALARPDPTHTPEWGERVLRSLGISGERPSPAFRKGVWPLLKPLDRDDREKLLGVANERGWVKPHEPLSLPDGLELLTLILKSEVVHGGNFMEDAALARTFLESLAGLEVDTRNADTIAEQFLRRVNALQEARDLPVDEAIQQARRDVLDGVPKAYLPKVLERMLDREEAAASPEDAEALRDGRDERRKQGWAALTGRNGRSR